MIEYVMIDGKQYPLDTSEEIIAASRAMSAAGVNKLEILSNDVPTGRFVLADSDVDPVENGTAPSLATVLELAGVKALAIFIAYHPTSPEKDWPHFEWLVTLERDDIKVRVPFRQGVGRVKPLPRTYRQDRSDSVRKELWLHEVKARIVPSAAAVVSTLIASSSGSDQTFHDWCGDFGYSEDSRKALETYLACQVELANLRRLLGRHLSAAIEAARDE
jgi:hypothetical protein